MNSPCFSNDAAKARLDANARTTADNVHLTYPNITFNYYLTKMSCGYRSGCFHAAGYGTFEYLSFG